MRRRLDRLAMALAAAALAALIPCAALAGTLEPLGEPPISSYNPMSPAKIALGKMLFFDRRLSGDGTMNCVSCHDPEQGFSDGLDISMSYPTTRNWRNSPTLINIAWSRTLFHDGRAGSLEEQALFPIMSAFEMNQNLDFLEEELAADPAYRAAFLNAFGGGPTRENVARALAAFERTLVAPDSPLDRYLRGDLVALTPEMKRGMDIFSGKGGCIQCHFGPYLSDHLYHSLGVPENPAHLNDPSMAATRRFVAKVSGYADYPTLAEDPGRYLVTKDRRDWKAFKTPTLRDIARTAPYMHNGVFETLDRVIDFYNAGCGADARAPLGLTADEKAALKTFLLEALQGEPITIAYPDSSSRADPAE